MPPRKNVFPISVNPTAKAVIKGIAQKHEMKEIGVASRIYEWFAQQDDAVQKSILRLLPEGFEIDVARLWMERVAAGKDKDGGTGKSKRAG